jgi:glutaredoxin
MAKQYLHSKNLNYHEMKLGVDLTREEFVSIFPEVKSMPFIIIDGEKVGGYDKLQEWATRPEQHFLAG